MHRNSVFPIVAILTLAGIGFVTQPGFAQPPFGETTPVGTTLLARQHNSTTGKMITCDLQGGVQLIYTKEWPGSARHVVYNYGDDGEWLVLQDEAIIIDNDVRSYFPSLALLPDDVAIAFYSAPGRAVASYDFDYGWGAFSEIPFYWPPDSSTFVYEPKGCVDSVGNIYLSGMVGLDDEFPRFAGAVWFASRQDDETWTVGAPVVFDTVAIPSQLMTSSKESGRTALVWHKNLVGFPVPERWADFSGAVQKNNDLYAAISDQRNEWDFENPVNITRTIPADSELEDRLAYGDTLRPYDDVDAIWINDVLHVVFTTRGFWLNPSGEDIPPIERISTVESFIWHWDSVSDTLTLVANGWFDDGQEREFAQPNLSKPSLGADETGRLYCIFRQITPEDDVGEVFASDIGLSVSEDGGVWSEPLNITNSHLDGQDEAQVTELCPSLAERVDDNLHFTYLLGWAGRGIPAPEESVRMMFVVYHRIPIENLPALDPLPMPRESFQYHNREALAVSESPTAPSGFGLTGAYPNPFNSETRITFSLDREQRISLSVTDLGGREVARIAEGKFNRGVNTFRWNATGIAAGIYLARLQGETGSVSLKIAMLK